MLIAYKVTKIIAQQQATLTRTYCVLFVSYSSEKYVYHLKITTYVRFQKIIK